MCRGSKRPVSKGAAVYLGAELTLVPSEGGEFTKQLFLDMIDAA